MSLNQTSLLPGISRRKTSFLDLSAELRNEIYMLALVEDEAITVFPGFRPGRGRKVPPLLDIPNHLVRAEARSIFYGSNIVQMLPGRPNKPFPSGEGLKFGANCSLVQKIRLTKEMNLDDRSSHRPRVRSWLKAIHCLMEMCPDLSPDAIVVPFLGRSGEHRWCKIMDIVGFKTCNRSDGNGIWVYWSRAKNSLYFREVKAKGLAGLWGG